MIDSIWPIQYDWPDFEYDQLRLSTITLTYQNLKMHLDLLLNIAVRLDSSPSPGLLCSHGFTECYLEV